MAKVLHAADFHLDSAFRSLPEEQARLRRQESRELPGRLVDWANDHGAQLMLLAGDLFDSDRLYSQTAQMLAQALSRFRGTVVIAPGNHDWLSAASPYRQPIWPENVASASAIHSRSLPFFARPVVVQAVSLLMFFAGQPDVHGVKQP